MPLRLLVIVAGQAALLSAVWLVLTIGVDPQYLLGAGVLFGALVLTVILHEAAHFAVARRLGAQPYWAQRRASVYSRPRTIRDQRLISAAGPLAGAAAAMLLIVPAQLLHDQYVTTVLRLLAISQLLMMIPGSRDGSLLVMRKEKFNES